MKFFFFTILLSVFLLTSCDHVSGPSYATGIDSGIATGAKILWKIPRYGNAVTNTQPIREGNRIYIGSDTTIFCLSVDSGKIIWSKRLVTDLFAENMILDNGRIFIVDLGGVYCLNSQTGDIIWNLPVQSGTVGFQNPFFTSSAQSGDAIFVPSWQGGDLFKISKATGQVVWRTKGTLSDKANYSVGGNWNGSPLYSKGRVYVPARYGISIFPESGLYHDGSVACFDANTGERLWIKIVPPMEKRFSKFVGDPKFPLDYWTNVAMANIIILDDTLMIKTGNALTWMDIDGNVSSRCGAPDAHGLNEGPNQIRFWRNHLLVGDYKNDMSKFYSLDPKTHQFEWTTIMSENRSEYHSFLFSPAPSYVGNTVYFLSDDYFVLGVDVETGIRKYAMYLQDAIRDKNLSDQVLDGGFLVDEDHHIFIMDNHYIYCLQMNQ